MVIALTHFGSDEFLPLLKLWVDRYLLSGTALDVVVLADMKVKVPDIFEHHNPGDRKRFTVARFDPIPDIIRPDQPFDMKGSLILCGLQLLQNERVLLVDSDAFFVKNPAQALAYMDGAFFMGEDPMTRYIRGINGEIKERNAGVLFFGTTSYADRSAIQTKYLENFKALLPANDDALLEQVVWTKTWHDLRDCGISKELPRSLNWSYIWGRSDDRTIILHEHGPQKWAKVPGANLKSQAYNLFK